jgi:hypothetical protein
MRFRETAMTEWRPAYPPPPAFAPASRTENISLNPSFKTDEGGV